ncbi:nitroreductase family deazaflavin-dependent oxidoreductase [Conexibacter sp. JD483]|uniref:nitroreductase family deazaflavin-dependent oxidoreductase n=1 Tax=unclassified Conexibacter TaxID=2627773 RepID=UPI0027284B23|nr:MULTISPECIES: nitroreductase family deazaflavin-dependent oxidoreductase [unclassified Conexibacter]MDO8188276.1 nitroreductase family deazaflavin-dependent oxidoreductase [Conexibacter sp. CPCC 205706]MDO8197369.1 nitroreductase family deazaflavin-dependent oxidoreductase [Conexibacter sp. CPCC 205762]MDR9370145.1 nitroreductase family deazaflavin-dependent oxidoreductase [Conexibacter sp. JD483]
MLFGKEHVKRYEETDGAEGHDWQGTTALILTTTGRKSGEARRTPLIYQRDGDAVLIVASRGGDPQPPQWYLNLSENPQVGVQIEDDRFSARARTASDDERTRWWPLMTATWPAYDEYQTKTDRPIPIVVLEREG